MFKKRLQQFLRKFCKAEQPLPAPEPVQDLQTRLQHLSERYPSVEPAADAVHVQMHEVPLCEPDFATEQEMALGAEIKGLNNWVNKRRKSTTSNDIASVAKTPFEFAIDPGRAPSKASEDGQLMPPAPSTEGRESKRDVEPVRTNELRRDLELLRDSGSPFDHALFQGRQSLHGQPVSDLSSADQAKLAKLEADQAALGKSGKDKSESGKTTAEKSDLGKFSAADSTGLAPAESGTSAESRAAMGKLVPQTAADRLVRKRKVQDLPLPEKSICDKAIADQERPNAEQSIIERSAQHRAERDRARNAHPINQQISDAAIRELARLDQTNRSHFSRSLSSFHEDEERETALADKWDCCSYNSLFVLPDESIGVTTEYEEDYEDDLLPYFTETLRLQEAELAGTFDQTRSTTSATELPSLSPLSSNSTAANASKAFGDKTTANTNLQAGQPHRGGLSQDANPSQGASSSTNSSSDARANGAAQSKKGGHGNEAVPTPGAKSSQNLPSNPQAPAASSPNLVQTNKTGAPQNANADAVGTESSTALQPYKNFSDNALKLIAQKPETPAPTLKWLASHSNPHIRAAVAKNPSTPGDTITVLAKDHEAGIRHSIAENPLSSMDALNLLVKDRNPLIAWRAQNTVFQIKEGQRAAQKAKEAAMLEQQREKEAVHHVKEAKIATTEETIAFLQVIARKTNTPVRRLDELARHADARVRGAVAENANAPAEILWLLSKDPESSVKTKVTDNYNCPIEILEAMKEDEDAYVAYQAHSVLNRVLGASFTDNHIRTATWP